MLNRRHALLSTIAICSLAPAQVSDLGDAINKAGRQRMLSQRMGKAWFALLLNVDTQQAQLVLDRSMALYDRQHVELKAYASTAALKQTFQELEAAWSDYKGALVGQRPNRDSAGKLLELAANVLRLANQGTGQFESQATRPAGRLVNIAGRQRMLSQRMAKFYFAAANSVSVEASRAEIGKARSEFLTAMATLKSAPEANQRIKDEISLAEGQWVFFDQALQKVGGASASAAKSHSDVFVTSENVLSAMDKVTGLYAALQS